MPFYAQLGFVFVGLMGFIYLKPRNKFLVAFAVMSAGFDLLPTITYGYYLRDPGFILFYIAWLQVVLQPRLTRVPPVFFYRALQAFIAWCFLCLIYGVLVSGYPLMLTLKAARQLILGSSLFFGFVRLYEVDPGAFRYLVRCLYVITMALLILVMVQYVTDVKIFYGHIREYAGSVRAIPVFLPICFVFAWFVLSRSLSGRRVAWHELCYLLLAVFAIALTYTRGIYLAFLATWLLLLAMMMLTSRLRMSKVVGYLAGIAVFLAGLLMIGALDKVATRFVSGISVLGISETREVEHRDDVDTFTGRLILTGERIEMVAKENPLFGFAFIHETLVPDEIRNNLKSGSPIRTPEYLARYASGGSYVLGLHTADIGWANIIIDTGLVGFALFLAMIAGVMRMSWKAIRTLRLRTDQYWWVVALFLGFNMLVMVMFNGEWLITYAQNSCFILASLLFAITSANEQARQHARSEKGVEGDVPDDQSGSESWRVANKRVRAR
jgi:hypothetical protein